MKLAKYAVLRISSNSSVPSELVDHGKFNYRYEILRVLPVGHEFRNINVTSPFRSARRARSAQTSEGASSVLQMLSGEARLL